MAGESSGTGLLLDLTFTATDVTALRHRIADLARGAGLGGDRLDDFALAAYELLTNAVRHGGGAGRLLLRHAPGRLICQVADDGVGFVAPGRKPGERPPEPTSPGGLGLFLAERLTDGIEVVSDTGGTTVRIYITTESEQSESSYPMSIG
ncbi:anti-sigma regulatory factor (Ser/Thr protein kinase) [Catenuloplanes nepalensis]|uniref:Anti-sigma regulatory factor (Ser/Thr protein kinase) n=1 Tax=Catenuloplanes nepalensis TaxID=587533 RepID=A0ABT9N140_9ACTN|nr:ATP-binding protein [Catenuloplanes nepalensis]MDP9797208.1 anti-sigma regulatory factor (Ser/Thr protein kinase) [Catenuloplanes nepalensis]